MHIPTSLCTVALAAVAFLSPIRAQVQAMNPGDERTCCMLLFADMSKGFDAKGALNLNYTAPAWKDSYTKALDGGKFNDTNQRLGKNWWTSFDTMVPVTIGGTKVNPGAYYLGIHVTAKGEFQLMVFEAKTALTSGWVPFNPKPWKADVLAPLTLAKDSLAEAQTQMVIAFSADEQDTTKGKFSIQWGKHELSAPVVYGLPTAKDASASKEK